VFATILNFSVFPFEYKKIMLTTALVQPEPRVRQRPLLLTQDDLPYEDNVPMETERHKKQMELLINSLQPWLDQHQGGYVNGNMFVYYSPTQVRSKDFKGPDVFVVLGVSNHERKSWVVWQEQRSPDVVIELLSDSTALYDKGKKKTIYRTKLNVPEYFWFDPFNPADWAGFRLKDGIYRKLKPQQGCLISRSLGLTLIRWHGVYQNINTRWLRWATLEGELLLLPEEAEKQRADLAEQRAQAEAEARSAETQRADLAEQRAQAEAEARRAAEAELASLRALLANRS
jgi:Uma2 family endonuclease